PRTTMLFRAPTRTITFDVPARSTRVKSATLRCSLASTPEPSVPLVAVDVDRLVAESLPQPLRRTTAVAATRAIGALVATVVGRLFITQSGHSAGLRSRRHSARGSPGAEPGARG